MYKSTCRTEAVETQLAAEPSEGLAQGRMVGAAASLAAFENCGESKTAMDKREEESIFRRVSNESSSACEVICWTVHCCVA